MRTFFSLCAAMAAAIPVLAMDDPVPLAGSWRFQLDRADVGLAEQWHTKTLPDRVTLPGTLPAQGIGDDVGPDTPWIAQFQDVNWMEDPAYAPHVTARDFRIPFWLQPDKYYAGAAWYQRDIEIPEAWKGRRVVLVLERPHWETRVWLDAQCVGTNLSLFTPHEYDLGTTVTPGRHTLTIRVDNRMVIDVGQNSHCVSDHTQGNWNGIVGRIELRSTTPVWMDDVQVYPDVAAKLARVRIAMGNATGQSGSGTLSWSLRRTGEKAVLKEGRETITWSDAGGQAAFDVALGSDAVPWDEFSPALYDLALSIDHSPSTVRHASVTFGLREVSTQGTQIALNGRPVFLRGTLECCIFPLTGHPPVDMESWKKVIRAAQAHGLNHIRFHSYCPPEAAFAAADELGFYYQVETCWANQSTTIGDGRPVDRWVYDETERILRAYGNHPSFLLMPYGNEPGGGRQKEYLAKWIHHFKAKDPRRLWSSGAGWPELPENQFFVTPTPRIQGWGQGLKSRINAKPPETRTDYRDFIGARTVPVISHEIGQWCVYPNLDEIPKYRGYLKPRNFEIFRDSLKAHHMADQARAFLLASGKLQTLCYKEDIESALRTPGMAGFQLLDLHDFPGQGTALVGVLDPFWESKGYVTPEEFRRFCDTTVPLARLAKRVFVAGETLESDIEVAHFGASPLTNAVATWRLAADDGRAWASGKLPPAQLPTGRGTALGRVRIPLQGIPSPARYKLAIGIEGTSFENDWDVWVYPPRAGPEAPAGVTIVRELDDAALDALRNGGRVLWQIPPRRVRGDARGKVALGFSSIFWNTAWTRRQAPHTLGILCDPRHPLFSQFPTDAHSNWQWWYLVRRAGAMILDDLPPELRPTIQVIDDWVTNRRLGLAFEGRIGRGRLLVCSIDLEDIPPDNPVAAQLRRSLLDYMAGDAFAPTVELTAERVRGLMDASGVRANAAIQSARADSEQADYEAELAIDGDPRTIWHTAWGDEQATLPHTLVLDLGRPRQVSGLVYTPRTDMANGRIAEYEVHVSADGRAWGDAVSRGSWANDAKVKIARFPVVEARYVRLRALKDASGGPHASAAEVDVLQAD